MTGGMMFKGTPGPWLNAGRSAGAHIHADIGEVAWLRSWVSIDDEQIEANANLIAAAPELLEALISIVDRSHNGELGSSKVIDMRKIAEGAIAKVLGEQK